MNRLSLYVFTEEKGILRESDKYCLKGLREVSDVTVIVNGRISEAGAGFLKKEGYGIFRRKNSVSDFDAWKDYLGDHSAEISERYDELILCDSSCFGPVFPLKSIFDRMGGVRCDFWGMYRHPAVQEKHPAYLEQFFIVIRQSLLRDTAFVSYFRELEHSGNSDEAAAQESGFTAYFEEKGFVSAGFADAGFSEIHPDAPLFLPERLLESGFPFVRREVFSADYRLIQSCTDGTYVNAVMNCLEKLADSNYPADIIWQETIRSLPNSVLRNLFHLTYALDSGNASSLDSDIDSRKPSAAAVLYSYFDDLIEPDFSYLSSMPKGSTLFIVVVSEKMKSLWDKRLSKSGYRYEVRIQPNRGRNEAAYWVTCRDVIESYDYICLIHDKKTLAARPPVKGQYWSSHCWRSVLYSPEYVNNVIRLFDSNDRLGILMPTAPMFAEWPDLIFNREWAGNRDIALKVYDRLKLTVPFDEHPAAPWGAMFWVRGRAMKVLYRYSWSVNDFPEEPLKVPDGTVLHALERMYPMIAQESGYLSGWIVPSDLIGTYYDNLYIKSLEYQARSKEYKARCDELGSAVKSLSEQLAARQQAEDEEFYSAGYLEMYPDVAKSRMHPMRHYVLYGKKEGRDNGMHPDESVFFAKGYLAMYQDVAESGINPWRHYVECGKKEGRDNGLHPGDDQFFAAGYLVMYPDVAGAGVDPWRHYAEHGKKEGRDNGLHPGKDQFSAEGYLKMYPDVAQAGVDPWRHYAEYGKKEGRGNGLNL